MNAGVTKNHTLEVTDPNTCERVRFRVSSFEHLGGITTIALQKASPP